MKKLIFIIILLLAAMSIAGKEDREASRKVYDDQASIRKAAKDRNEREMSEDRARAELIGQK